MKRFIVASAFLSLVIPLALNAQTIPPQNTTCNQTDPIALATCIASTTVATTSTTTSATTTTPFPIDIPVPPSIVMNVREALTAWLQKNTPVSPDTRSWLNIGPLSANNADPASASSVITDLQKALDQNTFIVPGSFYTPKTTVPAAATSTAASPSPEIQAEITAKLLLVQEILAKIDAIKAAMSASSTPDTNAPLAPTMDTAPLKGFSFTKTLRLGSEGDDVQKLQQFLAQDPAVYPEALITGYFGSLTRAAVGRWQIAHHIVSSESTDGFGIVGPKTRAAIIEWINSGSTTAPTPENTSIAPPTQDNTSAQSNGSTDPSSLGDPMTSPVMEADTSATSSVPTDDTWPTSENDIVDTWSPENVIADTAPLYDVTSPDGIGLKWF